MKKQEVLGQQVILNDIYHISEIEDISMGSHQDEFIVKYDGGRATMTFSSPKLDVITKTLRSLKTRYQLSEPSTIAVERVLGPNDVPGTLLNMALLNMGSGDPDLRLAAYDLLQTLCIIFNFDVGTRMLSTKGLCIPANVLHVVKDISSRLAEKEVHLTLEFLLEFCVGYSKSTKQMQLYALEYVSPWLRNLWGYCKNAFYRSHTLSLTNLDDSDARSLQKVEQILRALTELTIMDRDISPAMYKHVWAILAEGGVLIVPYLLEMLIQKRIDVGVQNPQGDTISAIMITLATVNRQIVCGKIISRLRKALAGTATIPTHSFIQHPSWPEIWTLTRFILMLSFDNLLNVHQFLPEIFYLVSLLVGVGAPSCRHAVHGIVVNVTQTLCTLLPYENPGFNTLKFILADYSEPKFCLLFGLSRGAGGSLGTGALRYENESPTDISTNIPLNSVETIINSLLDVMTYGAPTPGIIFWPFFDDELF